MEHVIIAWGTVLVTALLLFWIFQVITRFIKHQQISQLDFFDGFLMITLLIGSAASIYTLAQLVEDAIRVLKRKNGTASKQMPDLRIFFVSTAALPVVTAAMFSVSSVFSQYPVIRTVLIAATAYTSMK